MDVVYSCSDLYSELAGISMVSLFENNRDMEGITVYVVDCGISEQNREKLCALTERYQRRLVFRSGKDVEEMAGTRIAVNGHSTVKNVNTYLRLLLGSILPDTVERVLYLDCDTLVLDSLRELWTMDMAGAYAMGVDDCRGKLYRREIGLPDGSIYTNNGVLLIDLRAWRKSDVEAAFFAFIRDHAGVVTFDDQGVLNGVLGRRGLTGLLPARYNTISAFYFASYDEIERYRHPVWAYPREEIEEAVRRPAIVHFTSFFVEGTRPWNAEDTHPMRESFLAYKALSPWRDAPAWPDNRSGKKKLSTRIYRAAPRPLLLAVFSVLHTELYPKYRIAMSRKAQKNVKKQEGTAL